MIIDKLIKYSHLILFKKSYSADQFEFIVLNRLIQYHDILKEMTSDRNKFFTSNYWKTFVLLLNIKLRLSIAYHFEIDNQIKRINQALKQYLQHYVNNIQNIWIIFLSITHLIFNSKHFDTIKMTSFYANFERESNLLDFKQSKVLSDAAEK